MKKTLVIYWSGTGNTELSCSPPIRLTRLPSASTTP